MVSPMEKKGAPMIITDKNFEETVKNNRMVVVDCYATWCMPCKMIAPTIETLASEYGGKIIFGRLDVDISPQVATKFGIMSVPTLLFFKEGALVDRIVGVVPKQTIEQTLFRHLK